MLVYFVVNMCVEKGICLNPYTDTCHLYLQPYSMQVSLDTFLKAAMLVSALGIFTSDHCNLKGKVLVIGVFLLKVPLSLMWDTI
jgi:hypothetical protein